MQDDYRNQLISYLKSSDVKVGNEMTIEQLEKQVDIVNKKAKHGNR